MTGASAIQAIVSGLANGAVYGLIAMGFALAYGATRMVSIAHGDVVGASVSASIAVVLGSTPVATSPALGDSIALCALTLVIATFIGLTLYVVAVRPFIGGGIGASRSVMGWVAFGAAGGLLLRRLMTSIFERDVIAVPDPLHLGWFRASGVIGLPGGAQLPSRTLGVIALGLVLAVALDVALTKSLLGQAIRAVSSDPDAAGLVGIQTRRLLPLVFALAGTLAGVAALLGIPGHALTSSTGVVLGLKAIAAALLWRLGSPRAAFLGGTALGVIEGLVVAQWGAQLADAFALGLLVVLLATRPQGLAVRPMAEVI